MGFFDDAWKGISGATGLQGYQQQNYNIDDSAFAPNADEQSLIQALQAKQAGTGPSVAQQQMQQGVNQAQNSAASMAASQRGINPALAAKLSLDAGASAAADANAKAGALRAQEQTSADNSLAQELQSGRQGRMSGQQLHVQNTQGQNQIGMQSFQNQAGNMGNLISGAGAALAMADGGVVPQDNSDSLRNTSDQFTSAFANAVAQSMSPNPQTHDQAVQKGFQQMIGKLMGGGGAGAGGDAAAGAGASAGPAMMMSGLAKGGEVPGHASVPGDSKANDKVPTMLSPGEIVIPRSVAQMSPDKIAQFVMCLKGA